MYDMDPTPRATVFQAVVVLFGIFVAIFTAGVICGVIFG